MIDEDYKDWRKQIVEKSKITGMTIKMQNGRTVEYTPLEFINFMKEVLMQGMFMCDHIDYIAKFFGVDPKTINKNP